MRAWWKWLGLAGVVGVAATGAAIARQERQRRAYTAEEIRTRLHERYAEAEVADPLTVRPALGFIDSSDLDHYNRGKGDDHTDIRQRNKQSRRM